MALTVEMITKVSKEIRTREEELDALRKAKTNLVRRLQKSCQHPHDMIIDEGGMFGSVCRCMMCNKIIQHSGGY